MSADSQSGDHAPSRTAASPQSLVQVRVVYRVCCQQRPIRSDELSLQQIVNAQTRPTGKGAMATPGVPASDAH